MKTITIGILLFIGASVSSAQTPPPFAFANDQCEQKFEDLRNHLLNASDAEKREQNYEGRFVQLFSLTNQPGCAASLILAFHHRTVAPIHLPLTLAQQLATTNEKQAGSTSSTSGSTSLVAKNFTSRVLSLANEYGALTSSTSGQTTSVAGSLDQLFVGIEKATKGNFIECALKIVPGTPCIPSGAMTFLSRVSYSASLDSTQPSTIKGATTGSVQGGTQQVTDTQAGSSFSLSQFTAKFFLLAARPSQKEFLNKLTTESPDGSDTDKPKAALKTIQENAESKDVWKTWRTDAIPALLAAPDLGAELFSRTQQLIQAWEAGGASEDDLVKAALAYSTSLADTAENERKAYDAVAYTKPILTFQYDYNTPTHQPTNSAFRLIWGQSFEKFPKWKVTANVVGSIYNSTPSSSIPGSGMLRDIQVGAEVDRDPYQIVSRVSAAISGAYYFQDQTSPAILNISPSNPIPGVTFTGLSANAMQVFTQKGNIHVGQFKVTLGGNSSSGWQIPISITGSNRTELITKPKIGAQIGISYNFDSLFSGKAQ